MKSEGVKDIVEWLEDKCKEAKAKVEAAERSNRALGMYEDCGDFYRENLIEARARLSTLVEVKIGAEKYMKKLRHEGQ
jgi:predicted RNase H-like nuclease (RuvC/YqgF family)